MYAPPGGCTWRRMHRRLVKDAVAVRARRVVAGLVLVALAAGCSSGGDVSSPPLTPFDSTQLRQTLVDRILPLSLRTAVEQNRINDVASCLEGRGFRVIRPPATGVAHELALNSAVERLRYGIPGTYQGELGITSFLAASATAGSSRVLPADGENEAFLRAEIGDLQNGTGNLVSINTGNGVLEFDADGCVGASYLNLLTTPENIRLYTQLPSQLQSEVNASLEGNESVVASLEAWSTCAEESGETLTSPSEVTTLIIDEFNVNGEAAAQRGERELAALLRRCEAKSGLFAAVAKLQPSIEDQILADSDALVVQLQQAVSDAASP